MNRSLLYGFLAGLVLAVVAGLVLYRMRPAPAPAAAPGVAAAEHPAAAAPGPDAPGPEVPAGLPVGRYQLVSSIEILMLDTATGELWFYRRGRWHRGAGAPRDEGDTGAVLGELDERGGAAAEPPAAPAAAVSSQERGRAEVIQVESAPERPARPERKAARDR